MSECEASKSLQQYLDLTVRPDTDQHDAHVRTDYISQVTYKRGEILYELYSVHSTENDCKWGFEEFR